MNSIGDSEQDESGIAQRFAIEAVRDTLGKSTDVDSCLALAVRIDALISEAFNSFQNDGAGIACRAGCSFCCHLRVMVYPHEAIALFRYLKSRMPKEQAEGVRARLIANAAHIGKTDAEGRVASRVACGFLVEGKCSAYEARPSACSGYHSLSKEHCEKDFALGGDSSTGTPVLQGLTYVAAALDDGLEQGLSARRLSGTRIELHTALAALIRNPALIEKWRSGRELVKL